jgi:hypothetical protein
MSKGERECVLCRGATLALQLDNDDGLHSVRCVQAHVRAVCAVLQLKLQCPGSCHVNSLTACSQPNAMAESRTFDVLHCHSNLLLALLLAG